MKRFILVLPVVFLLSGAAHAVMCSGLASKDLSAPGESLYPLRITDQDKLGICHLEQLHKLLQAKMEAHPDLSRFHMGLVEKKMRDKDLSSFQKKAVRWWKDEGKNPGGIYIDAGTSCEAYELIKGQALCEAKNEKLEKFALENPKTPTSILNTLSAYFDKRAKIPQPLQLDAIQKANESCLGDPNLNCVSEKLAALPPLEPTDLLSSSFYQNFVMTNFGVLEQNVSQVNELITTEDRDVFFDKAIGSCSGEKVVIPDSYNCKYDDLQEQYKLTEIFDDYAATVSKSIDTLLEQGTPVGISICTRMFKTKLAETIRLKTGEFTCGDKTDPGYKAGEGSHAVAIIGNRCVNGTREYLVQNSWGKGCSYYDSSYECTGNGGVWIPSDIVLKNTRNLQYFQ